MKTTKTDYKTNAPELLHLGGTTKVASTFPVDWTLSRRYATLESEFMAQLKDKLKEFEPSVDVDLAWNARVPNTLSVRMMAADGKKKSFDLLVESPSTAAGDILYKHGGY